MSKLYVYCLVETLYIVLSVLNFCCDRNIILLKERVYLHKLECKPIKGHRSRVVDHFTTLPLPNMGLL